MTDWNTEVRSRLTPLGLTAAAEAALTEELAQHLEDLHRDLRSAGASEEDASARTLAELDDLHPLQAGMDRSQRMARHDEVPVGDARLGTYVEDLRRDLRYAGRNMRRHPLFVAFVVITLGLGIGANTTVFTVIDALIVNPLPVPHAAELVGVQTTSTAPTSAGSTAMPLSYPNLIDYQARNAVFRSLAGYTPMRVVTWQAGGASQGLFTEFVTPDYFPTLGVRPAAGRAFLSDFSGGARNDASRNDRATADDAVAVMNYGTWQTRFGGADVIGKQLRLNNVVVTVIGVAPQGFIGVNALVGPDLWIPMAMAEQLLPAEMPKALRDRGRGLFNAVGRLKPGVTASHAHANVTTVASALAREHPAANDGHSALVRPIREVMLGGRATTMLLAGVVLMIVVGIVLLIACSNVANLLLARSAARQPEMAVRLALGASRRRLVQQLLTESVAMGLLSGAVGVTLGHFGMRLLAGTLPASGIFTALRPDAKVLLFALAISAITGVLFGILPAFTASRASVAGVLKDASRTAGRSRRRITLSNTLLVGQIALSFLLLVTAMLFLRSIQRAYAVDPGFQTTNLAVFVVNPGQAGYGEAQARAFYNEVRERVTRVPGVASASWASNMPLWARPVSGLQVEGRLARSHTESPMTIVTTVDRDYFETAGVAIVSGRAFSPDDRQASLPVAIVNEKLAQDYWPGDVAIGKRLQLPGDPAMRQIVGVARTVNYTSWAEPPQRCAYVPLEQNHLPAMMLYVRSHGDPAPIVRSVQRELTAIAPQVLVSGIRTGAQIIDGALFQGRIGVAMLSVFGMLALALASIGLYGILAYAVNQRRREIGLRMALGASPGRVCRLILGQGMSLVLTGVAIGFLAALLVGRLLRGMLYGVGAADPLSLAGAVLLLTAVALLACYLPARGATRGDPLDALREA